MRPCLIDGESLELSAGHGNAEGLVLAAEVSASGVQWPQPRLTFTVKTSMQASSLAGKGSGWVAEVERGVAAAGACGALGWAFAAHGGSWEKLPIAAQKRDPAIGASSLRAAAAA